MPLPNCRIKCRRCLSLRKTGSFDPYSPTLFKLKGLPPFSRSDLKTLLHDDSVEVFTSRARVTMRTQRNTKYRKTQNSVRNEVWQRLNADGTEDFPLVLCDAAVNGSYLTTFRDRDAVKKRRVTTANQRCVTSQTGEHVIYTAMEVRNHASEGVIPDHVDLMILSQLLVLYSTEQNCKQQLERMRKKLWPTLGFNVHNLPTRDNLLTWTM